MSGPGESQLNLDPAPTGQMAEPLGLERYARKMIVGIVFAVLVASALALFGDLRDLGDAFKGFNWWLIAPVLLLTCFNYGLRWVKWEMYLRVLDLPRPSRWDSICVYLSAFSMSVTPGKVGELIKAVLLRRLTGAPVARTTAIIAAERITDGLAMLCLAGMGLLEFSYGRPLLAVSFVLAVAAIVVLQRPALTALVIARTGNMPLIGGLVEHLAGFFSASNVLFQPRLVAGMVVLGVISWFGECVAFFLVLCGLGFDASWRLLLIATFVLAVSSVFGAVSMLPGGLGVAEASMAGMLLILLEDDGISRGAATAATLIVRFATLWFAVFLGFAAMAIISRKLKEPAGAFLTDGASSQPEPARLGGPTA
jgi:uncharacterized protein (TIRG00374 family)